jgi:oligo-1,6-glucosidase
MHERVFAGRDKLLSVGETPGATVEQAVLYTDPARREVDMVFQFEHVGVDHGAGKWDVLPLRLTALKESLGRWHEGLAKSGWNSLYWNNHDQPRVVSRFGDDSPRYRERSAKMLGAVLHLHRGTPYVYQGEELGMTNMSFGAISDYRDIEVLNHHREATTHLGHTDADVLATRHGGFTTGAPWIAVNPNTSHINAAEQEDNPDSVFSFYREVIALRHAEPVVAEGDFTMLLPDDEHVYAFRRTLPGTGPAADAAEDAAAAAAPGVQLLVLGNFSGEDRTVELDGGGWGDTEAGADEPELGHYPAELVLGNYPSGSAGKHSAGTHAAITLRPWELKVFRRQHNN